MIYSNGHVVVTENGGENMGFFGNIDFNSLSDTDQAIYHYMSSNVEKVPYMRLRDIAKESHTSASSVMRLIRKLGYESYTEFRSQFSVESVESDRFDDALNILSRNHFPRNIESKLNQIIEKIQYCENIVFFGIGASGSICEYAARRFASIGYNSSALIDPTYPILSKLKNTSDNILVTLSVSGMTTEVVEIVNGFRNKDDFTTVAITADINSTLAKMSDFVLDYHVDIKRVKKHEDLTSQIPCIFLIEQLANRLQE